MLEKYKKIIEEQKRCLEEYESDGSSVHLEKSYSIDVFFEAEIYKKYEKVLEFCQEHGFTRIFDIGSAFGLQSEVFLNSEVEYVGIDDGKLDFWNKEHYEYIVGNYPFEIKSKDTDLAVSSLCLGWNCYLYEGNETLNKQFEALSRDFKYALVHMQEDYIFKVSEHFKTIERFGKFIYLLN